MTPITGMQTSTTQVNDEASIPPVDDDAQWLRITADDTAPAVVHTHIIGHAYNGVTIIREYDHEHPHGNAHHTHARLDVTVIDEAFMTIPVDIETGDDETPDDGGQSA